MKDTERVNDEADKALAFLQTLRRSSEMALELLNQNRELTLRSHSLDSELENTKARCAFLEREMSQLRNGLARFALNDDKQAQQFEELMEEQNCLAHLFVTSDRLFQVNSVAEALTVTEEILHNLVGARRYGVWLCGPDQNKPILAAPRRNEHDPPRGDHGELIAKCLKDRRMLLPNGPEHTPVYVPLMIGNAAHGVIVVEELVPQRPRLERLHRDLLGLLSERLARTIHLGVAFERHDDPNETWQQIFTRLDPQRS